MSSYREDCIKAKAVREGIVEQRPVSGKNGKVFPIVMEYRYTWVFCWNGPGDGKWRKWNRYRTKEEAQMAMDGLRRKRGANWEFRLRPEEEKP